MRFAPCGLIRLPSFPFLRAPALLSPFQPQDYRLFRSYTFFPLLLYWYTPPRGPTSVRLPRATSPAARPFGVVVRLDCLADPSVRARRSAGASAHLAVSP